MLLRVCRPKGCLISSCTTYKFNIPAVLCPVVYVCRPKGSFLRGSCESFSLSSAAGDIGRIEAVKVWHEPTGAALGGGWCLQQVDVEAVFRGGWGDVLPCSLAALAIAF